MSIQSTLIVCLLLVSTIETIDDSAIISTDQEASAVAISSDEHILQAIVERTRLATISPECATDLQITYNGIRERIPWAIAMFDASVKVPIGVEHGAIYQFGNFDQCMAATSERSTSLKPRYCLADVTMAGYTVRTGAARRFMIQNDTVVHWGVCVPSRCGHSDVASLLATWTGQRNVSVSGDQCHTNEQSSGKYYTANEIMFGCVIVSMLSMVFFCTAFHVYLYASGSAHRRSRRGVVEQIIMSFSLIENVQKLGQESRDEMGLAAINGIKAISMLFIIAGHALLFMVGGPIMNADFYAKEIHMLQNAILLNSPLLVDTFLLLSGFLFTHLLLVELEKRHGQVNFLVVYLFRYIRLTPAYLAVIALYGTWLPRLGSGPLWDGRMALEQERCQSSWWINLLYVNNYVGTDKLCMFQSWYLAADTQLFVLAPLVLYPLWRWRKWGISLLVSLIIISIIVPLMQTLVQNADPSLLPYADEVADISANHFFISVYIKTHMRATSFLFGILAGYLVHYIKEHKIHFSPIQQSFLWISALVIGFASMFSIVLFFGVEYSPISRALYAALHRLGWSYATSWVLLACILGYAGQIRTVLASPALVPLSRLTYCAYLTNGLVELFQAASIRSPKYMSVMNLFGETISHIVITFLGAMVLCLIFESPIHGIEKIFLRKDSNKLERRSDNSLSPTTCSDTSTSS